MIKVCCLVLFLLNQTLSAQFITTNEQFTPLELVENILINSGCASVSNVSVSGGNFSSGENSWGYFNAGGTTFPFTEGVLLSTGKISNAPGPNTYVSDDTVNGWGGDADLNTALNINNSLNATVLEFDFIPLGNQISFDYIFASEEYHGTATCQYSDGFAFLLKEVGTSTYQNLALIPNTNIPVKVTSVHPAIPGGCPAQNEQYFDTFNGANSPTNFNGQTKVLTAKANVIPGQQYHIKLVIADEGNYRYDSAIFLKGSSFSVGVDLGEDRTFANQNPVCFDEVLTLDGTAVGAQNYQWLFNGNPMTGENTATLTFSPPYTATQNGTYTLVTGYSPTCTTHSDITLDFSPIVSIGQTQYSFCDSDSNQDGISTIATADVVPTAFTNLPSGFQVGLFDSPTSVNPLPATFQNNTAYQQTYYAKILNNSCYDAVPITLTILTFPDLIQDETVPLCLNVPVVLEAQSGYSNYVWSTGETGATIVATLPGSYTVSFENASGCSRTQIFTVIGSEAAQIDDIIINDFGSQNTVEIVASGMGDYEYSIDGIQYQSTPVFTQLSGLQYTAYVRDKKGCGITTQPFFLIQIPKYFTPNGDGIHDTWYIKNLTLRGLSQAIITIFDRYGKIITRFSGASYGWDGTYNNRLLPADDYWFTLSTADGVLTRGHFSLKR
ncbi:choice-of-anchor L domain-containing protein [Flavobacterium sp.]|uniref:choice-of-anchor L domain-containing protein n=1 Tax=Flavobacterium sp. TaxID=239 RepID=UPI002FDC8FC9